MIALLIGVTYGMSVLINPIKGLCERNKVDLLFGETITYKANYRTILFYGASDSLNASTMPETVEVGPGYSILQNQMTITIKCINLSGCIVDMSISQLPGNYSRIRFIDEKYFNRNFRISEFNETEQSLFNPWLFVNTEIATFNIKIINPFDIGDFVIYNSSFDNPLAMKGQSKMEGEIISTHGLIIKFVPNENLKTFKLKHSNANIFRIELSDVKNNELFPIYKIQKSTYLELSNLYKENVSLEEFIQTIKMVTFQNWSCLSTYENDWKGFSGAINDGRNYSLALATNLVMRNEFFVSKYLPKFIYQNYFPNINDFWNSNYSKQFHLRADKIENNVKHTIANHSLDTILNFSSFSQMQIGICSISIKQLCMNFIIGFDQYGKPEYLNISEVIESKVDQIIFVLDLLGMNNSKTLNLVNSLINSPESVFLPDILDSLHIEFKYILKFLKIFENLFYGSGTTYRALFGALPTDITPIMARVIPILKDFVNSRKIHIYNLDVLLNDAQKIILSLFQTYELLFLDLLNAFFKFTKYVVTSNDNGDFSSRLSRILNHKNCNISQSLKNLLVSFSLNQMDIEQFMINVYPKLNLSHLYNLFDSILNNNAIIDILSISLGDNFPLIAMMKTAINIMGDKTTKLDDVFDYIEQSSLYYVNNLRRRFNSTIYILNNQSLALDNLFNFSLSSIYNASLLQNLTSLIQIYSTNIESILSKEQIGFGIFDFIYSSNKLLSQTTLKGFLREINRFSDHEIDTDRIVKIFFGFIRFFARRNDSISQLIPEDLISIGYPLLKAISHINQSIINDDIRISELLKCFHTNGDQIYTIFVDFVTELRRSNNITASLRTIPKTFIDVFSTLENLSHIPVASFINIYNCIVIQKSKGYITLFDIIPLDRIRKMITELYSINSYRKILLSDLANHIPLFDIQMGCLSFYRSLCFDKIRPLSVLKLVSGFDFQPFFNSILNLFSLIKAKKLGPASLADFASQASSFIDSIGQKTPDADNKKPPRIQGIPLFTIVGPPIIIAITAFFFTRKKKPETPTEMTLIQI